MVGFATLYPPYDPRKKLSKPNMLSENFWINFCLIGLIALSLLNLGAPTAIGLDPTWTQALGYAVKNNLQAGVDYIFTYGPLGYFAAFSSYDPALFDAFIAWQLIESLFLAACFVAIGSQIEGKIEQFIYYFLLIVVISLFTGHGAIHFLAISGATVLAITILDKSRISQGQSMTILGIILLYLAIVSLTKFTNFVLVGVSMFAITIAVWYTYSFLLAIATALTFAIFLFAIWLASGQALLNFPLFILNSLEMSSGYSEAMSFKFTPVELTLAVIYLGVMGLMILLAVIPKPRQFNRFVVAGFVVLSLFLVWKAGFVRQGLHQIMFFNVALILPFFLAYNKNMNAIGLLSYRGLRLLAIGLALAGLFSIAKPPPLNYQPHNFLGQWNKRIVDNFYNLTHLSAFQEKREQRRAELQRKYALPTIRAQVGSSTVDVFSWEQWIVFLNELNWHPRPVFHSYAAYTPSLIAINGHFYASDKAPEFVIFLVQAIDDQYPWMNDHEALKILLRDYQPLLLEKGYLLLKRKPRGQGLVANGKTMLTQTIHINESLDIRTLSDKQLLLHLEIQKSILGQFYSLLYRLPEIYLEIVTTDEKTLSYRIIPKMTQGHFVINPLIRSQFELTKWHQQFPLKSVATLRVVIKPDWLHHLFKPKINLTVSEFEVAPYPFYENFKVIK
jgi:hypothetical protein